MATHDGKIRRKIHRHVSTVETITPDFVNISKQLIVEQGLRNTVLVDTVMCQHVTSDEVLNTLKCHLVNNIIQVLIV